MYPHLAAELHRLSGDALDLWGNAETRRRALTDILAAWDRGDAVALERAVRRVDAAAVAGLEAPGLGRDPRSSVEVDSYGRTWIGHVTDDGTILLDVEWLRQSVATGRADRAFRTWVHESVHARGPARSARRAEYRDWPGYEEGLADGLARLATAAKAGMPDEMSPYDYFVAAYRALARAAGLDAERLWRALWRHRPGEVRANLPAVVDRLRQERAAAPLSEQQHSRLIAVADRMFAAGHQRDRPDPAALARLWEVVFR